MGFWKTMKLTEQEVRKEYNQLRNDDPTFAECWSESDYDFYEWCSGYLDYKHIKANGNN